MPIISSSLGRKVVVNVTATETIQVAQTAVTYGEPRAFNGLSSVSTANDTISYSPNPFRNGDKVKYFTATGNTAITGLTNAAAYYVVSANSTTVKLSLTSGGAANNITAGADESGHYLQLLEDVQTTTLAKVMWSMPDSGTGNYINITRTGVANLCNLSSSGVFDFMGNGMPVETPSAANVVVTFTGNANASCVLEFHKQSVHRGDQPL